MFNSIKIINMFGCDLPFNSILFQCQKITYTLSTLYSWYYYYWLTLEQNFSILKGKNASWNDCIAGFIGDIALVLERYPITNIGKCVKKILIKLSGSLIPRNTLWKAGNHNHTCNSFGLTIISRMNNADDRSKQRPISKNSLGYTPLFLFSSIII